jgi:hypothetical protein
MNLKAILQKKKVESSSSDSDSSSSESESESLKSKVFKAKNPPPFFKPRCKLRPRRKLPKNDIRQEHPG